MFCSKCGAAITDVAAVCPSCGQATGGVRASACGGSYGMAAVPAVAYAGFWLRFIAWIIDRFVLSAITSIVLLPFVGLPAILDVLRGYGPSRPEEAVPFMALFVRTFRHALPVGFVMTWLYYALMESSAWQGTLGKKALGLRVTDLQGNQVSFGRASGRFFSRIITWLTFFVGFIMAGFTGKKQALHDMIADCLVIKQEKSS